MSGRSCGARVSRTSSARPGKGLSAVSGDVILGDRRFSGRVVPLAAEGRLVVTLCELAYAVAEEG